MRGEEENERNRSAPVDSAALLLLLPLLLLTFSEGEPTNVGLG